MAVKYKYPDESEVIIEGTGYRLKEENIQIEVIYYQAVGIATYKGDYYNLLGYRDRWVEGASEGDSFYYVVGALGDLFLFENIVETQYVDIPNVTNGLLVPSAYLYIHNNTPFYRQATDSTFPVNIIGWLTNFEVNPGSAGNTGQFEEGQVLVAGDNFTLDPRLWQVSPASNWHEVPRIQIAPGYTLEIFNGTTLVFSRSETFQPEYVEIIFQECPENTCPVKCGDYVCCYGSDGIAVESFLFSESVYQ